MKLSVSKYELWNALFMSDDSNKTEDIKELESKLNASMGKPGRVVIDIREEAVRAEMQKGE